MLLRLRSAGLGPGREEPRYFAKALEAKIKNSKPSRSARLLSLPLGFIEIVKEPSPQRSLFILAEQVELILTRHGSSASRYMSSLTIQFRLLLGRRQPNSVFRIAFIMRSSSAPRLAAACPPFRPSKTAAGSGRCGCLKTETSSKRLLMVRPKEIQMTPRSNRRNSCWPNGQNSKNNSILRVRARL